MVRIIYSKKNIFFENHNKNKIKVQEHLEQE